MYRGRLWTMRQYAGFGTAAATNLRFKFLLGAGQTGLSCAFDLPTQMGYDADHARAEGEVGKVGVAISSLEDMRDLLGRPAARSGDDVDDDQRDRLDVAVALSVGRRGTGRARRPAARHDPERHLEGVRGARHVHLPAATVDAPRRRHLRLLRQGDDAVEHDLDLGLSHPRSRFDRGPRDRLHARQRHRLRRGRARRRPGAGRLRARGSASSSTRTTTSSKRSPSTAPRGACGPRSCATASARPTRSR